MREAGIEPRPAEHLPTWWIDLRPIGGPWWRCERRPHHASYLVYDAATGVRVMCAPPKSVLAAASEMLGRMLAERWH